MLLLLSASSFLGLCEGSGKLEERLLPTKLVGGDAGGDTADTELPGGDFTIESLLLKE
jgi:hypothetical protein